jgi:hypothetical protein
MTIIKDIHKGSEERHLYKLTVVGSIDFQNEILTTEFWPFQKQVDNHCGLRFYIDRLIVKRDIAARTGDIEVNHAWLYLFKEELTGPPNYYLKHSILVKGAWQNIKK